MFPEFGTTPGTGAYTDARIQIWITVAEKFLTSSRWDTLIDLGTALFVAHYLVLDGTNQAAAQVGGSIGQTTGPLSSKSIDKISAAYETAAVTFENAGHWNLSTYGIRFYGLMRMVGAGGIEIAPTFDTLFTPQV